ncbi:MAG TPA: 2-amino-4-hydroxy-6-hydroxymethyldihydropteridine diphosphokinase [Iamia sp.]
MTGPRRVLLALGSNLGDRAGHLRAAVAALGDEVVATSAVYETPPVGGPEQGPYLNAVVALRTDLSARALLARAHELEAAAGRVRLERWGPRTLDVDVLWIDGEEVDEPDLVVPHPRMFERAFVLVPLADVAPDLVPADAPTDDAIVRLGSLADRACG